jgi:anti-sigma-K factor RskA
MLADGTLPARRSAALERRVAQSNELARALATQRSAIAVVRACRDPAPPRLRARVERALRGSSG